MRFSEAMARSGAEKLATAGRLPVVLPSVVYTAAEFAAAFPGTLSLAPEAVTAVITGIARSLAAQDFRVLAIANSHLDPVHLASIRAAVQECEGEGAPRVVFPDLTRKPWALRLGDEFRSGACHAGQFESSVVLAEAPEQVRDALPLFVGQVEVAGPTVDAQLSEAEKIARDLAYGLVKQAYRL